MGEVYKALDTRLDRIVAIKQLTPEHRERFEREARAIAALNHPNICQVYDVGPDYLVLEYLEGQPVRGPLPPEEAVRVAIQIAGALQAAHERGHPAPRPETGEHHGHRGRHGEAPRLRRGQTPGACCRRHRDHAGRGTRDPRVYVAGTSRGTAGRRAVRHLQLRRGPLRDPRRTPPLRREHDLRGDRRDPARRSAAARRARPRSSGS